MAHTYATKREKRIDLWLGFAGWFVVNIVSIGVIQLVSVSGLNGPSGKGGSSSGSIGLALSGLLLVLDLVIPIVLAFTRRFVALGILVAFATAFALTVVEGVFFTIGDFVAAATQSSAVSIGALVIGFILFAIGAFFVLRAIHRGIK